MRGAGPYYWERQRVWVHCMACGEDMAVGLLVVHLQMHHGNVKGGRKNWKTTAPSEEPCTYSMAFPTAGGPWNCTIKGFLGRASPRTAMRDHLFHWHVQDNVIILEEGKLPQPRCTRCNILAPWSSLNGRHLDIYQCAKGAERKHQRLT